MYLFAIVTIAFVSCFYWIWKQLKYYKYVIDSIGKLGGLKFVPIIGCIQYNLGKLEHLFENHLIGRERFGKLYGFFNGPCPLVMVASHENAEIVLSSSKTFKLAYLKNLLENWMGNSLSTTNDDTNWHLRRSIMGSILNFEKLEKYYNNTINDKIEELRKKLRNADNLEQVDTYELATRFIFGIVSETTLGRSYKVGDKNQEEYLKNIDRYNYILGDRLTAPWNTLNFIYKFTKNGKELAEISQNLRRFTEMVIAEQEGKFVEKDASSGLDTILEELFLIKYKENTINNEAIREEIDTIIYKSYSLTSRAISFTLMLLACNRECQDKLFEEISTKLQPKKSIKLKDFEKLQYLDMCIKESLRLYPIKMIIGRECEGITTHEGFKIPRCSYLGIYIHLYNLHRDSNVYPDPEKFDPERFSPEPVNTSQMPKCSFIPFGGGARKCPGEEMSVLEIKAAVVALLRDYIIEPVDTPESLVLQVHLALQATENIRVKLIPRH